MPPEPAPAPPPPPPPSGRRDGAPSSFNFSTPIDIAADVQPDALRRIARARSNCSSVGCEVIVLHGGANAGVINLQLNLLRLRWTNTLFYAFESADCAKLGGMLARLPDANERRALTTTPCVHDTTHTADDGHLLKWIRYTRRWLIFARLVRLGYNALTIDADIAVVDDAMPYLHSRHLCGRFGLMFATERVSGGLQNGVAYACGYVLRPTVGP